VLPTADEREARAVAARLQTAATRFELGDIGLPDGVSMSIGTATATLTSSDEITHAADVALYEQKSSRARALAQQTSEPSGARDTAAVPPFASRHACGESGGRGKQPSAAP
jgi:GGDEF domain-containing protein